MADLGGFGSGAWGSSPWGSGATDLVLLSALAVRENAVLLTFSEAPYFSELLDPSDASNPERFSVVADTSTEGLDGLPARPVRPVLVEQVGSGGAELRVTLDRRMSPYPAVYRASGNNLRTGAGSFILPSVVNFFGLAAGVPVPQTQPSALDFANPQSGALVIGTGGAVLTDAMLGSYVADSSGDYATDSGPTSLKKRLIRRAITRRGRFAHLPTYGWGLVERVKELASAKVRSDLRSEGERQSREEPEVEAASVTIAPIPLTPGAWSVELRVRTKFGSDDGFSLVLNP